MAVTEAVPVPLGPDGTSPSSFTNFLEGLKAEVMAEIDARWEKVEAQFAQKEESLWRRGQVELRRLHTEQVQLKGTVEKLQGENQKLTGALLDVTNKFEVVVSEMHQVLRAMPQATDTALALATASRPVPPHHSSPALSLASTATSEAARFVSGTGGAAESRCAADGSAADLAQPGSINSGVYRQMRTPASASSRLGACNGLEDEESASRSTGTFCTPPRAGGAGEVCVDVSGAIPPLTPSPAVLSLASVLPSASSTAASFCGAQTPQQPSPGLKQLHLAQCLDQQADTAASAVPAVSASAAGGAPSTPPRNQEGAAAASAPGLAAPPFPSAGASNSSVAGGSAPAAQEEMLHIQLEKESGFPALGIEVNQVTESSLRVEAVELHGLVARHNVRQDSDACRILRGDRLIEVNGERDPSRMLQECKAKQQLAITLLRPVADASAADWAVSPVPTRRLRPEAEVFVPSAQKEAAPQQGAAGAGGPEDRPAALVGVPPALPVAPGPVATSATAAAAATSKTSDDSSERDPEVKRMLFA
eukprot:TRINITY_DN48096_c0_g1_i1.p1 TRINITY_DN48096_c0_g1~~TRINITY_DN48096_c0_g1_i1.p1  ORF type:complete len:535 (-),score=140.38 TRINITY_DN48096_c0_g1_i1:223-1827(-)